MYDLCICVNKDVHISVCVCVCLCVCLCASVSVFLRSVCLCVTKCLCVCMCACVCECVSACVRVSVGLFERVLVWLHLMTSLPYTCDVSARIIQPADPIVPGCSCSTSATNKQLQDVTRYMRIYNHFSQQFLILQDKCEHHDPTAACTNKSTLIC